MSNHAFIHRLVFTASSLVLSACGGASARPPTSPEPPSAVASGADPSAHQGAEDGSSSPASGATPAAAALAESAGALAGSWRCSGSVHGPDGPSPSQVTLDVRLDLDAAWLRTAFAVSSGKYPYEFRAYRTFDSSANQWVNVIVDNIGGHTVSRSSDGIVWTGEAHGPMGKMGIRDTETLVAPGELRMLGEYSLDTESWHTGYELSCSK